MKKICILLTFISIFIIKLDAKVNEPDSICQYCIANNLDSVLLSWFYYTGKDSLEYFSEIHKKNLITDISESLLEERIRKIITPIELSYNKEVHRFVESYLKKGQWSLPKFIGLSHQYFPIFEEKLDAYNMPLEIKYLAVVESALNPTAKSISGATGLWQFMYQTGKYYGFEINSYLDERMDPVKSTEKACQYLKVLYKMYNDWTLAIAAYNCGPGTVNNAIRRAGGTTNYWELYPYLPKQTREYIPRFFAMIYLFTYADNHGFKPEYIPFYNDIDTVMVCKEIHFAQIDSVLGISVAQLRELNPQYKMDIIPAKTKCHPLRIRRQDVPRFIQLEDSIHKFQDSIFFNPQKYNYKPNENYKDAAVVVCAAQPVGTEELIYVVKSGDIIGLISSWYNVTNNDIKAWNGLSNSNIKVGQKLKIYVPKNSVEKYMNVTNMSFEEKQKMAGVDISAQPQKEEPLNDNFEYYTVQKGDTPYNISKKFNVSLDDIMKWNDISNPSGLKIGQKLKVGKKYN